MSITSRPVPPRSSVPSWPPVIRDEDGLWTAWTWDDPQLWVFVAILVACSALWLLGAALVIRAVLG